MEIQTLLICGVFCLAGFVRGLSGFAFGLFAMALLPQFLDLNTAITLVAVLKLLTSLVLVAYYRQSFKLQAVARLILISAIAVPIGVIASSYLNKDLVLEVLGILIVSYAFYALVSPHFPKINQSRSLTDSVGLAAGLLNGAYNTGGPPLVIYSDLCEWEQNEFKVNLPALSIFDGILAVVSHGINHELTLSLWQLSLITLPGLSIGMTLGVFLSKFINELIFKRVVLIFLLLIGLKIVFDHISFSSILSII